MSILENSPHSKQNQSLIGFKNPNNPFFQFLQRDTPSLALLIQLAKTLTLNHTHVYTLNDTSSGLIF